MFQSVLKLSPILVLILGIFYINGSGLTNDLNSPIAIVAMIGTAYGILVSIFLEKHGFQEVLTAIVDKLKSVIPVLFILMLAYALAETFMVTGVGAAVINLVLSLGVNARTVALIAFLATAILSVSTGTSYGTFAALVPMFLWINYLVAGNFALTLGAVAGGSCFGDNIGLISDTTIVSSGLHNVEVSERVKYQGLWSLTLLIMSAILFLLFGFILNKTSSITDTNLFSIIPEETWNTLKEQRESSYTLLKQAESGNIPMYMLIPIILVITLALFKVQSMICLFMGIITAFFLGSLNHLIDLSAFLTLLDTGFSSAGSSVLVNMLWVGALSGVMASMNAFVPVSKLISKSTKSPRALMFSNALLACLGNIALADEMAQILTVAPIIKEITENNIEGSEEVKSKYRLRNALFNDSFGVFGSQLIPWHVYVIFFLGMCNAVFPKEIYTFQFKDIISYNFISILAVVSLLIMTITPLDNIFPGFGLPKAKIKKKS